MTDYFYKCLPKRIYQNGDYILEAVQPEQIEKIRQWRNDQMDILRQSKPISKEEQIQYYENYVWPEMYKNKPDKILFSLKSNGELIGYGGLVNISWEHLRGEMSFLLDSNRANNNGTYHSDMSSFIYLNKEICLNQLAFNRLFTETFEFRHTHIDILKENGFILEGRMRQHIKFNNEYSDSLIHSIVRHDFVK